MQQWRRRAAKYVINFVLTQSHDMAPSSQFLRERGEPRLEDRVPVVRVARHAEDRQVVRDPYREVAPLVA